MRRIPTNSGVQDGTRQLDLGVELGERPGLEMDVWGASMYNEAVG